MTLKNKFTGKVDDVTGAKLLPDSPYVIPVGASHVTFRLELTLSPSLPNTCKQTESTLWAFFRFLQLGDLAPSRVY